jgi:hypothetical protein
MTVKDVQKQIHMIAVTLNGDDEQQHSYEDALHKDVLREVAAGAENSQELAIEALKTVDLNFDRWCA